MALQHLQRRKMSENTGPVNEKLRSELAAAMFSTPTATDDISNSETQANRSTERKIVELPLEDIIPSKHNKYDQYDEEKEKNMINSIEEFGVLENIIVRPLDESPGKYELISGENRWRCSKKAGKSTISSEIRECTEVEAVKLLNITNLSKRDKISLYERIQSYKDSYDTLSKQGKRSDLQGEKRGQRTDEILGKAYGVSGRTFSRLVGLAPLIRPLVNLLENKKITKEVAETFVTLSNEDQNVLSDYLTEHPCKLSPEQAQGIIELCEQSHLTPQLLSDSLNADKPVTPKVKSISTQNFMQFFRSDIEKDEIESTIIEALTYYRQHFQQEEPDQVDEDFFFDGEESVIE